MSSRPNRNAFRPTFFVFFFFSLLTTLQVRLWSGDWGVEDAGEPVDLIAEFRKRRRFQPRATDESSTDWSSDEEPAARPVTPTDRPVTPTVHRPPPREPSTSAADPGEYPGETFDRDEDDGKTDDTPAAAAPANRR